MSTPLSKPSPWMVAAWPGMGNVALIAAGYLIQQLRMTQGKDLPLGDSFDVTEVTTKDGIVQPVRQPRGIFFHWTNPGPGRDLVVFISEAQPTLHSIAYADALLDAAVELGVECVVTFASLASGLHPSDNPKVSGVATDEATLASLQRAEVEPVPSGEIGGLNGLLLGVAARRGFCGICLLAEIPFFAMRIPNPKAARAALSVFSVLADVEISLESIDKQAAYIDRALIEAMEELEKQTKDEEAEANQPSMEPPRDEPGPRDPSEERARGEMPQDPAPPDALDPSIPLDIPPAPVRAPDGTEIDPASLERIEQLFLRARQNTAEAVELKAELDRLHIFKRYEGRFLDLFRRAG